MKPCRLFHLHSLTHTSAYSKHAKEKKQQAKGEKNCTFLSGCDSASVKRSGGSWYAQWSSLDAMRTRQTQIHTKNSSGGPAVRAAFEEQT